MFSSEGLAISLPARNLRAVASPGTIYPAEAVLPHIMSPLLKAAIRIVLASCQHAGVPVCFIARPEAFTHGETHAWLMRELTPIRHHLAISDGTTVPLIPGLTNHLFFYAAGQAAGLRDFGRLVAWAPELAPQIATQVNTAFSFRHADASHTPKPVLMQMEEMLQTGGTEFHRFFLNPNSVQDSINRLRFGQPLTAENLSGFERLTYIPFSGAAVEDAEFCAACARQIIQAVAEPQRLLILGAPQGQALEEIGETMIAELLRGLLASGVTLPRAVLPHVLIAPLALDEAFVAARAGQAALVLPDSFEFWRFPRSYYGHFNRITLMMPRHRQPTAAPLLALFEEALGRAPETVFTTKPRRATFDPVLADD